MTVTVSVSAGYCPGQTALPLHSPSPGAPDALSGIRRKARTLFGWDENIGVVALLPVGYPDEDPKPRKRLALEEIMI